MAICVVPAPSARANYGYDVSRDVGPWTVRFARELEEPVFAPRDALAGKDARTLAREILGMTQKEFSAAFKRSPMKRANLCDGGAAGAKGHRHGSLMDVGFVPFVVPLEPHDPWRRHARETTKGIPSNDSA